LLYSALTKSNKADKSLLMISLDTSAGLAGGERRGERGEGRGEGLVKPGTSQWQAVAR
jgi:hypothetical protein